MQSRLQPSPQTVHADPWELYRKLLLIRFFEEKLEELFSRGEIHGTTHLCIGQEAPPTAICSLLTDGDYVSGSHRGHGLALAKGLSPRRLFAELLGRKDGFCKGKGGSQHLSCLAAGFLGTNGITGGGVPVATGAALALKRKSPGNVVISFFGDGAMSQGVVHEALNIASLWDLPVIYVCENNLYAMSTHISKGIAARSLCARAEAYCIDALSVDGNNVMELVSSAAPIIKSVRESPRPYFIEARTYRFCGHSKSDLREYRSPAEEQEWRKRDPLLVHAQYCIDHSIATPGRIQEAQDEARERIAAALAAALAGEPPPPDELQRDVWR